MPATATITCAADPAMTASSATADKIVVLVVALDEPVVLKRKRCLSCRQLGDLGAGVPGRGPPMAHVEIEGEDQLVAAPGRISPSIRCKRRLSPTLRAG
jgi:hypothetical protein